MTTIAIIGGGIAARSLLFAMAKKNIRQKILVFYSDSFAFPCSVHSTAIVAPRGISSGHSPLGDQLALGYQRFFRHFQEDSPAGVIKVPQYTAAATNHDAFQKRYPMGAVKKKCGEIFLAEEMYVAEESAFLIRPRDYMDWLLHESQKNLEIEIVKDFVIEVGGKEIRTLGGSRYSPDEVIFTTGVHNDLWQSFFSLKKKSRPAQGCYLEFQNTDLDCESVSLSLEGDNLVYDDDNKTVLIGSTTRESYLELPPEKELSEIYSNLRKRVSLKLPDLESGFIRTGLREKAMKREPYFLKKENFSMIGGLYKNGYSLSLKLAEDLLTT